MEKIIKQFGIFVLGIVAAALLAVAGIVDITTAVKLAFNPDLAISQAVELLNDTPKPEIVEAVKEQKPELVGETITEIKPADPAQ